MAKSGIALPGGCSATEAPRTTRQQPLSKALTAGPIVEVYRVNAHSLISLFIRAQHVVLLAEVVSYYCVELKGYRYACDTDRAHLSLLGCEVPGLRDLLMCRAPVTPGAWLPN